MENKSKKNAKQDNGGTVAAKAAASDNMSYDDIIGSFGKYQFMIFMFKILIGATSAFNNLGVTFFAPTDFVSHWCADNDSNLTSTSYLSGLNRTSLDSAPIPSVQTITTFDIPRSFSYITNQTSLGFEADETGGFSRWLDGFTSNVARKYRHSLSLNQYTPHNLRKECTYLSPVDHRYHKCSSYKYDTGIWHSTIIDEWNLVCDRSWFISVTQSLYMSGFIVSFLTFGYLSDRFGRWRSLLIGAAIEILSGFGCAYANSIGSFMLFRFLLGLGNAGRSSSSYLILIEWTGGDWRVYISTLGTLGWVMGYCSMPWIALFFLHFRHMQLFVCFYEMIFLIWLLRLPESPRWLLTHHRFEEAYEVLLVAAKYNGLIRPRGEGDAIINSGLAVPIDSSKAMKNVKVQQCFNTIDVENNNGSNINRTDTRSQSYTMDEFNLKFKRLSDNISAKEFTKREDRLTIIDLFQWRNLRKYTLILAFAWAVNSFVYYGIALNVGTFGGGNLFFDFTLAGFTEIPSIAFSIVSMKFLPRKTTNVFLFSTILVLCSLQIPLKYYKLQGLQRVTMMLAKLFNSCSFACILYQSMELFPTSIRQTAYSSCSLAGRIGSVLAPYIKILSEKTNNLVPPVIYATLSVVEILFIRHLPETRGIELPDTLLEAENFKGTSKEKDNRDEELSSDNELASNTLTQLNH